MASTEERQKSGNKEATPNSLTSSPTETCQADQDLSQGADKYVCETEETSTLEEEEEPDLDLLLTHLPDVVLVKVMEFLNLSERYRLSLTCRLFQQLFSHPQLWQVAHISLLTQGARPGRNPLRWRLQAVMHHTMATIVQKFGHLFQHLSLQLQGYVQPFDESSRMLLQLLNSECRLESLSLKLGALTSSDGEISRVSTMLSNFEDLPLVVGLIQNAVRLKRFSLVSWPFHEKTNNDKDIFEAILTNKNLTRLESLNLFFPELKRNQWTDRIPRLPSPDLTLSLVSHLRSLSHLSLRSPMLSDLVLQELASPKRAPLATLRVLVMYSQDSVLMQGFKVPTLSARAWSCLRRSSPQLQVEFVVFSRVPQDQLRLMLLPEVQLSAIDVLEFGRCDAELIMVLAEHYRGTLRRFLSLCDSPPCDAALVQLVKACDLSRLVYHGDISYKTVEKIASLVLEQGLELDCLEFKQRNVMTDDPVEGGEDTEDVVVAKDAASNEYYLAAVRSWHEDESKRSKRLDEMNKHVSKCLGYNWWPISK